MTTPYIADLADRYPLELVATAAEMMTDEPTFLAGALVAYQRRHGLDDAALAARLGCRVADLPFLALCYAPNPDAWHFWRDVRKIVTERVPCKADVLAAIVRGE